MVFSHHIFAVWNGAVLIFSLQAAALENTDVTYSKDIAPLVNRHCACCHHPGDVAPFSLLSFADVKKRAAQVARVTQERLMPPWKAERGFGHFRNVRQLADGEIELIQRWIRAGAPEGDPGQTPAVPTFDEHWRLGVPDLVATMKEAYTVQAEGGDVYQCFVVPLNLQEDKFLIALDYRPGNRRVVHHAVFSQDATGEARTRDAADPDAGYRTLDRGTGLKADCDAVIGVWAPGQAPEFLPPGVGLRLKRDAVLVIQNHYHPTGKNETDQSTVAFYFAKTPPDSIARYTGIQIPEFEIPAGAQRHGVEVRLLQQGYSILAVTPHMHLLGQEMKVTLERHGETIPLIRVRNWDWAWQNQYVLDTPLHLDRGTIVVLQAWYDNSAENPFNPNHPPRAVREGPASSDEMARLVMLVVDDPPLNWPFALGFTVMALGAVYRFRIRLARAIWS